jgi:chemotaxis protein methyltransferase CheR
MLEAAIDTNNFDKILSVNDISKLLYDKYYKKYTIEKNLDSFLENIKNKYNYDYTNYNKKHIIRRIEHYYNILKINNFSTFSNKILNNKEQFEELFLDISINTTTFFRDPEVFIELKNIFKNILVDKKRIKIWCAGCSSGEEPYSIAILLKELNLLDKSIIYATDINNTILQFAKNGLYSKASYNDFKSNYNIINPNNNFDNYFDICNNFVAIKEEFKENILFFKNNLVEHEKIDDFQVIICRNLIIYFNKFLTMKVFDLFDDSLESNGILLLGSSETFYNKYDYKTISKNNKIFLKGNNIG